MVGHLARPVRLRWSRSSLKSDRRMLQPWPVWSGKPPAPRAPSAGSVPATTSALGLVRLGQVTPIENSSARKFAEDTPEGSWLVLDRKGCVECWVELEHSVEPCHRQH